MPTGGTFVPCGVDHLVVLGIAATASLGLLVGRQQLPAAADRPWRRAAAVALAANEAATWVRVWLMGYPYVPLHLCDWAVMVTAGALWSGGAVLSEIAYFWGLAGGLQALATPDLREPFPHPAWWSFFTSHVGVVLSVVYLAATGRVTPSRHSVWRMWWLTNGYALAAGLANWGWGTNYGYLARKPSQPSLLDLLGPWPVYIVAMEVIALGSFALCYAPFALARRRHG